MYSLEQNLSIGGSRKLANQLELRSGSNRATQPKVALVVSVDSAEHENRLRIKIETMRFIRNLSTLVLCCSAR